MLTLGLHFDLLVDHGCPAEVEPFFHVVNIAARVGVEIVAGVCAFVPPSQPIRSLVLDRIGDCLEVFHGDV